MQKTITWCLLVSMLAFSFTWANPTFGSVNLPPGDLESALSQLQGMRSTSSRLLDYELIEISDMDGTVLFETEFQELETSFSFRPLSPGGVELGEVYFDMVGDSLSVTGTSSDSNQSPFVLSFFPNSNATKQNKGNKEAFQMRVEYKGETMVFPLKTGGSSDTIFVNDQHYEKWFNFLQDLNDDGLSDLYVQSVYTLLVAYKSLPGFNPFLNTAQPTGVTGPNTQLRQQCLDNCQAEFDDCEDFNDTLSLSMKALTCGVVTLVCIGSTAGLGVIAGAGCCSIGAGIGGGIAKLGFEPCSTNRRNCDIACIALYPYPVP